MSDVLTDRAKRVEEGLGRFSRFTDASTGRVEEQRFLETPSGRLLTTVVEPTGPKEPVAFLLCHSFAWEQFELFALELRFARAAAAAGFTAVCFQSKATEIRRIVLGGDAVESGDGCHRGRADAAPGEGDRSGRASRGPLRAYVAFSAGQVLDAPGAALWNPSLSPIRYLDGLLKAFVRTHVMSRPSDHGRMTPTGSASSCSPAQRSTLRDPLTSACYMDAQRLPDAVDLADPLPSRVQLVVINPRSGGRWKSSSDLEARGVELS